MANLILSKIIGAFTEKEHHKIAKIIKLASTKAEISVVQATKPVNEKLLAELQAEAAQLTSELTAEGVAIPSIVMAKYPHSVGLIMGREIWVSAEPANIADLSQKIATVGKVT